MGRIASQHVYHLDLVVGDLTAAHSFEDSFSGRTMPAARVGHQEQNLFGHLYFSV
jgi:hypothetical protein